ncbi:FAD-dependent oxidoreductase [Mariniblastus fucicola]|uniref:Kynurenine 3-monooxygenase n=1 Tax=Mariniblastus fucicola TaxID=980251 RepID=A0A5B9PEQ9_9BACT|nr:NAD(P)/FAD-dependent oxidoreductase [Mariniblastus fucicola]QEG23660.1 Kynurenine 3-monooxygenase [Mariniblastus fucicola]
MVREKKIVIVGAGLVGSLLGVMLGKRGYEVDLFERRSDERNRGVASGRSINLALSSRGIKALQDAGLYEKVKPLLIPMCGRMLHQQDGSMQFSPYGQREHEVIYSVPRGELNNLMVNEAVVAEPVHVHFDQKCAGIDFENRVAKFESTVDGSTTERSFDLVIGADGAGSRVRRDLIAATGGESTSEFLEHDYKELEIPAGVDGAYQIEKEALHIWPRGGFMLIALPNLDGSFTVTLFLHKEGEPSFQSLDSVDAVKAFFETHFPSAIPLMPELEQDYANNPTGILGTVRCSPWHHTDCGLILGDASHAIVPFHGQGMNSGFEDCSELLRLLNEYDEDWAAVLPEFSALRKPNADAIADMAIENHTTMQKSVIDPKFHLKKAIGFELEKRFPETFIPRYSLVMFHNLPYAEAKRQGVVQEEILNQLVDGVDELASIDFDLAERLVKAKLT